MSQTYADRYNTPVEPRPLHEAIAIWVQAGLDELELAHRLVCAGFEEAAKVHALEAAACVKQSLSMFENADLVRANKLWVEYLKHEADRAAHSEELLVKVAA